MSRRGRADIDTVAGATPVPERGSPVPEGAAPAPRRASPAASSRASRGSRGPGGAARPEGGSSAASLARLFVVLAAIVAVFVVAGLGDLLVVIAAIIVMVMVHELGHFAAAKWSRMKVTEYFVGFGPRLWSIRRGETDYGVKPILAGGYVKIPGMTNLEEIDPEDEPRTYRQQPFHKRIIVACAGSFMHLVMALLLAYGAILYFGVASDTGVQVAGFVQWPGHAQTAAQQGGLRAGDIVLTADGHRVDDPDRLSRVIKDSPGKPVELGIERDGRRLHLSVVPAVGHVHANGTETLGPGSGKATGLIGVSMQSPMTSEGPLRAAGTSFVAVGRVTSATAVGLGHVFSPGGLSSLYDQVTNAQAAKQGAETGQRIQSIVGAARTATQAEQAGVLDLIEVLIALNIAIGILNMLPMLPLDGGHVAIAVYERIRTRRGRPYYQADAAKLLPVVYAFVAVLVVIVGSAVFLDIAHPASNPFG